MSGFSNFLTNFSGGARIRSSDSSYNDLISQAILVPSFNSYGTNTTSYDGFIYLSNLLIQFSATYPTTQIPGGNNLHTYFFPINATASTPFTVQLSGTSINSNNPVIGLYSIVNSGFNFYISGGNSGNTSWVSIGLAPTYPVYTNITNTLNITNTTNAKSVFINKTGQNQYICNSTNIVYRNSNYGYGTWTSISLTNPTPIFSKIVGSLDGQTVVCANSSSSNTGNYYSLNSGVNFAKLNMPSNAMDVNQSHVIRTPKLFMLLIEHQIIEGICLNLLT